MQSLIDEFLAPETGPDSPYQPGADVVSLAAASGVPVIFEIFVRPGNTYGFRYSAWVGWRDAGGSVRNHSWWQAEPQVSILGSVHEAEAAAQAFASTQGVKGISSWASPARQP